MSYSTSNPPKLLAGGFNKDDMNIWSYRSADAVGDVDAAGYFTNGVELGMRLYDEVRVIDTTTPLCTTCWVSAVDTATGAVTVTQDA